MAPAGPEVEFDDATFSTCRVVSYPKSGRTWLRYLYYFYTLAVFGRPELGRKFYSNHPDKKNFFRKLLKAEAVDHRYPVVTFSHGAVNRAHHYRTMVDDSAQLDGTSVVLLVRDPRDVVVSHYHETRRVGHEPGIRLSCFLRGQRYGIRHVVQFLNIWGAAPRRNQSQWTLIYYEDLVSDPAAVFRQVLGFWGVEQIDEDALAFAVNESSFDNLQAREQQRRGGVARNELRVRRGGVGGHRDELRWTDQFFLTGVIQRDLNPVFGRYVPPRPEDLLAEWVQEHPGRRPWAWWRARAAAAACWASVPAVWLLRAARRVRRWSRGRPVGFL